MSANDSTGPQNFVVMGAGEVGFYLARSLSAQCHDVTVIDIDPAKIARIDEELDVRVVSGNGAHPPILSSAGAGESDLFMAVSSADEANLTASVIAKYMGAKRSVVRVGVAEEAVADRHLYETLFGVDLLLSTQLLTTTRILNRIRGHNTVAVEYLASGKVQLRKIRLDAESILTQKPLRDIQLPKDNLVVAFFRGDGLVIPGGDDQAKPGDDALILGTTEGIGACEEMLTGTQGEVSGEVVIAGGGETAQTVVARLLRLGVKVRLIERERRRAKELAARFPKLQVIHGDATDLQLLRSERIGQAKTFVALTGEDESNLMACLLAQELDVHQVLALVQRAGTSRLWKRLRLREVFSPRALAYERISEYIEDGYTSNIVSLQRGAALVLERRLEEASPAAGVTLAEMGAPRGLIVGAIVRGERVFVPRGNARLEVGDQVILFVREEELPTVQLLFPARPAFRTPVGGPKA